MTNAALFANFKRDLPSMTGKNVVITGTTSGTGQVAADTMALLGAEVFLLNRASERSSASLASLQETHPAAEIHAIECDLQSFASTQAAAEQMAALCPDGIDVLANNAGVMALADTATGDGFDVQMQTNHLSHFLLTRELMPLLQLAAEASGDARVVNHSSVARFAPGKKLKAEYFEKSTGQLGGDGSTMQNMMFTGPRWERYAQSKLANAAFTAALHHRLAASGSQVKALVAHPGLANTHLQKTSVKEGGMGAKFTDVFMRMSQSPEEGAMGLISGMALADAASGQFYGPGSGRMAIKGKAEPFPLEDFYDNDEMRELLWSKSEDAIGKTFDIS